MLRFFPPVVTGTIILVIGISLMRVGINWIFGNPVGPTAPRLVDPEHAAWLESRDRASASAVPPVPEGLALAADGAEPGLRAGLATSCSRCVVLGVDPRHRPLRPGFLANIAVLVGIVVGGVIAAALGMMHFDKVGEAAWFAPITPFHFGTPMFGPILIVTMTLVMIVVMIESTGMFLALSDITGKKITPARRSRPGLRMDGLGTILGGVFNTFPYT